MRQGEKAYLDQRRREIKEELSRLDMIERTKTNATNELKQVLRDAIPAYNKHKETAEHPSQLKYWVRAIWLDKARAAGFKGNENKLMEILERGEIE